MATKHTPGPWKVHNNIGKKGETGVIADAAPCIICTMGNAKEWPVEAEANARFIAEAPAVFDALKSLVKIAAPNIYPQPDRPGEAWDILQRARAVIAKVEAEV